MPSTTLVATWVWYYIGYRDSSDHTISTLNVQYSVKDSENVTLNEGTVQQPTGDDKTTMEGNPSLWMGKRTYQNVQKFLTMA